MNHITVHVLSFVTFLALLAEEFLQETADALQAIYPGRLSVTLKKGEYGDAITKIK